MSLSTSKVMEEVHLTTIKPKNNVLLLAQEISFAKVLACNDKRLRDRGVRRLKKWFMARSQGAMEFTKEDHLRIWKGLFYCMWMSDKPLIQEELAEEISQLIHSFATFKASLLFVETFFTSLSIEWFGIDQLRLDKFMMLVRRFVRQSLVLVAKQGWQADAVGQLASVYQQTLSSAPMGLSMHFIEIFCEELAKVGKGELSSETVFQFIAPFAHVMALTKDGRLISQITKHVFLHLMRQTELGIEHEMKFSAWKEYGFPGGNIDTAQKIEVDSDLEDDGELIECEEDDEEEEVERQEGVDARAGKVDVLLPPLDFDPQDFLTLLKELRNKKETTTKARKTLIQLITKYENLASGKYPLGLHKVELPEKSHKKKQILKAAKRLYREEQKMMESDSESDANEETQKKRRKMSNKKKNKALNHKKLVWEVSETNGNVNQHDVNCKNSWDVSDSSSDHNSNSGSSKKGDLKTEQKKKTKKEKSSFSKSACKENSFTLSETKENSFLSAVASTPKHVLKTATESDQNTSDFSIHCISANEESKRSKKLKPTVMKHNLIKETSNAAETSTTLNTSDTTENITLNTSTTETNDGWGGEWNEELKEGEYEIFIPNKKYVEKRKSLGLPYPASFIKKSAEKVTPLKRVKNDIKRRLSTPGSQKKVEFNLSANSSQDYKEYTRKLKSNKSQILFDANKKPVQGLLKNSTPSPINPFYKKKLKL